MRNDNVKYTVMIPAAGSGQRMGAGTNKLFLQLGGKPIFVHTLEVFERDPACTNIIIAVKQQEELAMQQLVEQYGISKTLTFVQGGEERQHSVAACIRSHKTGGIVLVHDAARPFVQQAVIHELVRTASMHGAAIAGVRAKDTMKLAPNGVVKETVNREQLWIIQTPQAFRYEVLRQASELAEKDCFLGTDESMLVERLGHPVYIVESTYDNVKMTTQEDLAFGEILLVRRQQQEE